MTDHQRKNIVEIISSEISSNGFVRMNSLTPLLERRGKQFGITRSIYGDQGPKRWIESSFPEFRIDGNYGKETIVFSTSAKPAVEHSSTPSNFTVEEETLSWDMLVAAAGIELDETAYKIGVINYCTFKNAFINQWHGKSETTTEGLSVIFNPTTVRTSPENIQFNTKEYVYLVCYAVSKPSCVYRRQLFRVIFCLYSHFFERFRRGGAHRSEDFVCASLKAHYFSPLSVCAFFHFSHSV